MIAEEVKESLAWAELVAIGRVGKAQGRAGEVVVNPLTDFPERFDPSMTKTFSSLRSRR